VSIQTITLVFVASPTSTQYSGVKTRLVRLESE